jgi:hypothetical protein
MLERAEKRLDRNLQNIFWGFITFTGFHTGLLGVCGYALTLKDISPIFIATIIFIAGNIIHLTSIVTLISYRIKLKANEKVIEKIEKDLEDFQQKIEDEEPRPTLFFGAGTARDIILWSLWIAEIAIAFFLVYKQK